MKYIYIHETWLMIEPEGDDEKDGFYYVPVVVQLGCYVPYIPETRYQPAEGGHYEDVRVYLDYQVGRVELDSGPDYERLVEEAQIAARQDAEDHADYLHDCMKEEARRTQ